MPASRTPQTILFHNTFSSRIRYHYFPPTPYINQSLISLQRIMEYLDSEDLVPYIEHPAATPGDDVAVKFTGCCVAWSPGEPEAEAEAEAGGDEDTSKPGTASLNTTHSGKTYAAAEQTDGAVAAAADVSDTRLGEAIQPRTPTAVAANGPGPDTSNRAFHTLRDVTFTAKRGQLVAIVGSVGSG